MTSLANDLRLALRGLRRSPLFSTVAILSLALGIGANTAIFTLLDQIILRKLPIARPDELVMLYQQGAHNGSNMGPRMHSARRPSSAPTCSAGCGCDAATGSCRWRSWRAARRVRPGFPDA
jgi:hypothetical protein